MENQKKVVVSGEFPGPNFESDVRAAAASENDAAKHLQILKKKIQTIEKNRDILELDDRDPEAELRALRAEVKTAEQAIQLTRQATQQLFSKARERHDEIKAEIWSAIARDVIAPHAAAARELSAKITAAMNEVLSLVSADDGIPASPLHANVREFDAGTAAFNTLAREFRTSLGTPVPENEFLRVHVAETISRNVRQNLDFRKFDELLKVAKSPQLAKELVKKSASGGAQ